MPAKSKKQRRFFGMVSAYKAGKMEGASEAVKSAAESMSKKEVEKYAKTKEKGLPEKKKGKTENALRKMFWG